MDKPTYARKLINMQVKEEEPLRDSFICEIKKQPNKIFNCLIVKSSGAGMSRLTLNMAERLYKEKRDKNENTSD